MHSICCKSAVNWLVANDLVVNPGKAKKLTNHRASGKDDAIRLTPPIELTLESALELIAGDEFVEVTPKNIRIRKIYLDHNERKRSEKGKKTNWAITESSIMRFSYARYIFSGLRFGACLEWSKAPPSIMKSKGAAPMLVEA